jgi:SOS-response transcriptional repressor LexA
MKPITDLSEWKAAASKRTGRPADAAEAERIATWLRNTMRGQDPPLSAERWARMAGISPTSITRFLKVGFPVPKQTTVAALAKALALPPPTMQSRALNFVDVPVVSPQLWREQGQQQAMIEATKQTTTSARHANCAAVIVTTSSAVLAGVLPGDVVVFDPKREPQAGELVIVALDTGTAIVLEWQPPWMVFREPGVRSPVAIDGAMIMGVAVQVQRDLPTRA